MKPQNLSLLLTRIKGNSVTANESINYLHEVFEAFGPIRARRMFGGWGIYQAAY